MRDDGNHGVEPIPDRDVDYGYRHARGHGYDHDAGSDDDRHDDPRPDDDRHSARSDVDGFDFRRSNHTGPGLNWSDDDG